MENTKEKTKEKVRVREKEPYVACEKRVYGVEGMMEWNALIPAGRSTLRVHFSGGTISGYGVTPARYETDNVAICHLIENSFWYKIGKIRRL